MPPVDTWLLIFIGMSAGTCFGFFLGAVFTNWKHEQPEEDDAVWLNELTHRAKE